LRPTPFAADSGFAAEGTRRAPAKVLVGEGVLPAPPLPLPITCSVKGFEKIGFQPCIHLPPVFFSGGFFFFLCLIFLVWGMLRLPQASLFEFGVRCLVWMAGFGKPPYM